MRHRLLFFLLIFMSSQIFAQTNNSFIAIRSGFSIPIGNYRSHDLDKGSFTTLGVNASADGAWFFTGHFGIGWQIGLQLHPVAASALATAKVDADPALTDLTIRSDPFRVIHAAMGVYSNWDLGKKFSLNAKLLGGLLWATTAYQLYKPTYFMTGPDYYEITSSRDHKFIIEPGFGLQYRLSSCIALKAETEFVSRNMRFGFKTWEGVRYDNKKVSFVNTLLGLVILL